MSHCDTELNWQGYYRWVDISRRTIGKSQQQLITNMLRLFLQFNRPDCTIPPILNWIESKGVILFRFAFRFPLTALEDIQCAWLVASLLHCWTSATIHHTSRTFWYSGELASTPFQAFGKATPTQDPSNERSYISLITWHIPRVPKMNLAELKDRLQALYNPDPTGTKRKMEIKNEHSSRVSFAGSAPPSKLIHSLRSNNLPRDATKRSS